MARLRLLIALLHAFCFCCDSAIVGEENHESCFASESVLKCDFIESTQVCGRSCRMALMSSSAEYRFITFYLCIILSQSTGCVSYVWNNYNRRSRFVSARYARFQGMLLGVE